MNVAVFNEIRGQIRSTQKPVTYRFIWGLMRPGAAWSGNHCQIAVMQVLGQISDFCWQKGFPVVSAAVVRADGSVTAKAENNLFNHNVKLGRPDTVGHTAASYFRAQQQAVISWA